MSLPNQDSAPSMIALRLILKGVLKKQFSITSSLIRSSFRQLAMECKMGMGLILFSTPETQAIWSIAYFIKCRVWREKWTNLYRMEKMHSSEHFVNQSVKILLQIPGLRLQYPSIKFGYEINIKGLMYLMFRLESEVNFFIGKFLQVLYFPSTFVIKTEILTRDF